MQNTHVVIMANVATEGVRSKMIEGLGIRFFEPGGYKIEPLLTNQ